MKLVWNHKHFRKQENFEFSIFFPSLLCFSLSSFLGNPISKHRIQCVNKLTAQLCSLKPGSFFFFSMSKIHWIECTCRPDERCYFATSNKNKSKTSPFRSDVCVYFRQYQYLFSEESPRSQSIPSIMSIVCIRFPAEMPNFSFRSSEVSMFVFEAMFRTIPLGIFAGRFIWFC